MTHKTMETMSSQEKAAQLASLRTVRARLESEEMVADARVKLATKANGRRAAMKPVWRDNDDGVMPKPDANNNGERKLAMLKREHAEAVALLANVRTQIATLEAVKVEPLTLIDVHLRLSEPSFLASLIDDSTFRQCVAQRIFADDTSAVALHGDVGKLSRYLQGCAMNELHRKQRAARSTAR